MQEEDERYEKLAHQHLGFLFSFLKKNVMNEEKNEVRRVGADFW